MLIWLTAAAAELLVQPFLQSVEPDRAWVVWEATNAGPGEVRYGGRVAPARVVWSDAESAVLEAELTGLSPATAVQYEVVHDGERSGPWTFRTAAEPAAATSLRLVAVSDMQRSGRDPEKWGEVVHEGILAGIEAEYGRPAREALDGVLLPGDLVDDGTVHEEWTDAFFGLSHPLGAEVPLLPVLGNHEDDSPWFTRYFHLPENGTPGFLEHWWSQRMANVLLVGLDSNPPYTNITQLDWLDAQLASVCHDPGVDFVFAQLHHPAWSELWVPGNNLWAAAVDERLGDFATDCSKGAVTFFGHTHGYARGQARDHQHLMVNVASAGGAIDYWGEQTQRNEEAFSVSDDSWGWVLIEVEAGDDPRLVIRRRSRGDNVTPLDNVETDRVELRASNRAPFAPQAVEPMLSGPSDCLPLTTHGYRDPDGDAHQATHWQIAADCDSFGAPLAERWRQSEDWYFGVDLQAGDDLTDETFADLPEGPVCWRVRFRDARLVWSAWSEPVSMVLDPRQRSEDRLGFGDAERGATDGWNTEGTVEVTGWAGCPSPPPGEGGRSFGLGGPCGEGEGAMSQEVDVPPVTPGRTAWLEGQVYDPDGTATITLVALDAEGAELSRAERAPAAEEGWVTWTVQHDLPDAAASVWVELRGAGAYVDGLHLRFGTPSALECSLPIPIPPPGDEGCGCQTGGGVGWGLLGIVGWRRRRR
jgi:hypothetical protein